MEKSTIAESGYSLPLYKLKKTVLYIAMMDGRDETPVHLEEMPTLDKFFDVVLDCSDAVGQEDTIESIRITCGWLDGRKPMRIRRKYPCTFDFFLEAVDKSPCWDKDGKCEVEVVVTPK